VDLLVADVTANTAKRYANVLRKFEVWLGSEKGYTLEEVTEFGFVSLLGVSREFIRVAFKKHLLTSHDVSTFCAALKRYLGFLQLQGVEANVDLAIVMKPLWRLRRNWFLEMPAEFRNPVNLNVALSLIVYFILVGKRRMALLTLLGFHCLLRPGEARVVKFKHFHFFSGLQGAWYSRVSGIVSIEKPKTRRMIQHAPLQAVSIEDPVLAAWIQSLLLLVPGVLRGECVWPGSEHLVRKEWRAALRHLGLGGLRLTMAGLRGGGAVHHSLVLQNIPVLRRRGRWSNEATLERYLQEALFATSSLNISRATADKIDKLCSLAPQVLLEDCQQLAVAGNQGMEEVDCPNDLVSSSSEDDTDSDHYEQ